MVCSNVISYRLLGVYAIVINILLVVPLAGFFYTFKLPALGIIPMIFLPPVIVIYRQTKQK